jgi:hypothetical protein
LSQGLEIDPLIPCSEINKGVPRKWWMGCILPYSTSYSSKLIWFLPVRIIRVKFAS